MTELEAAREEGSAATSTTVRPLSARRGLQIDNPGMRTPREDAARKAWQIAHELERESLLELLV